MFKLKFVLFIEATKQLIDFIFPFVSFNFNDW